VLVLYFCIKVFVKPKTFTVSQQPDAVYRHDTVEITKEDDTEDETLNNQRLMRTFYASVVVFVVFWVPLLTQSRNFSRTYQEIFLGLALIKTFANPIAYICVNPEFRVLVKKIKFCRN
jgi:hypothetical protein